MKIAKRTLTFGIAALSLSSTALASPILDLLQIQPSPQSEDYVANKKQFQLHELLTEQRHPKTWDLSYTISKNTGAGIQALLSVDEDISNKFIEMSKNTELLEQAAKAVENAILENKKIYIYGCGATGRLAKQMESSFWRPFWKKVASLPQWSSIKADFPNIENSLVGEMTGADRALISSLEGFEDLQLIGKLQLQDHEIQAGDAVFAVTEGGETSSVIGTILTASREYTDELSAKQHLYFMYNNPDAVLLPLDRSRSVIENDSITKIRLFTGPQSITGSTRMQATTSETFVMGIILEHAVHQVLKNYLTQTELASLGFTDATLKDRLLSFLPVQKAVYDLRDSISQLTDLESSTYAEKHFSTYFAQDALITVFIDSTERAPTFRLFPLDRSNDPQRKSWIQVWTPAQDKLEAWHNFLGRPFRGLSPDLYEKPFSTEIADPYLQRAALTSLKNAGNDQQWLYDFSFSTSNIENRGPTEGDLGVLALFSHEIGNVKDLSSPFAKWLTLFSKNKVAVILLPTAALSAQDSSIQNVRSICPNALIVQLPLDISSDPLAVRQHIGLKMLLNAHSTAVMAKLGRVVGNTMTNVNPGNLKLIGRATFLIMSHVNDALPESNRISYSDANAVLFDAIDYAKKMQKTGQNSEVGLSIIRILEALKNKRVLSWEETELLLQKDGLETYLAKS